MRVKCNLPNKVTKTEHKPITLTGFLLNAQFCINYCGVKMKRKIGPLSEFNKLTVPGAR